VSAPLYLSVYGTLYVVFRPPKSQPFAGPVSQGL